METMEDNVNLNECDVKDLLPTLFRLQTQRCLTYQRLNDAQMMFLNTRNFPGFQNFLSDITVIFARISEEILLIKKRFEDKKLIFKHIEQLQDYEQKKLQLTNDLFMAKIEKKNEEFEEINQKLIELIENINEILEELRYDQQDFT
jgi:methyl-accepting chemotaxis protein